MHGMKHMIMMMIGECNAALLAETRQQEKNAAESEKLSQNLSTLAAMKDAAAWQRKKLCTMRTTAHQAMAEPAAANEQALAEPAQQLPWWLDQNAGFEPPAASEDQVLPEGPKCRALPKDENLDRKLQAIIQKLYLKRIELTFKKAAEQERKAKEGAEEQEGKA